MDFLQSAGDFPLQLIVHVVYNLLWGDLITIPLPGGSFLGLVPAGAYSDPYGISTAPSKLVFFLSSVSRNDTDGYGKEESHS